MIDASQRLARVGSRALLGAALAVLATTSRAEIDPYSAEFRALRIEIARSLVKIEAVNAKGNFSLGTGVVVAPGKVVTNCHVTREAQRVQVLWGGLRHAAAAQAADAAHDLCVLHAPQLEVPPAHITQQQRLRPGQATLAAGFVGGQGLQVSQGEIVALHEHDQAKVIQSTTAFTSGASGGGLFNVQGELIGILTFRLRGADLHYFSSPAQWITAALQDPANARKVAPLAPALAYWQAQGQALPYFLQAAPLELTEQWQDLAKLSDRWTVAEAGSAQAWFVRGQAYTALKRTDVAAKALRKAVELDPAYEMAWYKLGLVVATDCPQTDEATRIAAVLERLDQQLSARLMQAVLHPEPSTNKTYEC